MPTHRNLETTLRSIRRRLRLLHFYRLALLFSSISLGIATLVVVAERLYLIALPDVSLRLMGLGAAVLASVVLAAIVAAVRRRSLFEAALHADTRLGLRERLSSAWSLRERAGADPGIDALLADAATTATRIRVADQFPFLLTGRAAHFAWPLVALLAAHFFMPSMNLFATANQPGGGAAQPTEVARTVVEEKARQLEEIAKRAKIDKDAKTSADVNKLAKDLEKLAEEMKTGRKEARLALAEMSKISEDIRAKRMELDKKADSLRSSMPALQSDEARDLQKELERNNFDKAAQKAKEMAAAAGENSSATPEQREKIAKDMEDMAKKLEKEQPDLAKAMQKSADALKKAAQAQRNGDKAGMKNALQQNNAAMAQAAEALQQQQENMADLKALEKMQAGVEQQKRELAGECGKCNGSGNKPGQKDAGSPGSKPGSPKSGQNGGQCEGGDSPGKPSLGNSNQNGSKSGKFAEGESLSTGKGMGGPGRGRGGKAQFDDANKPTFKDVKPDGRKNPGEILAVMNVDGPAERGESVVEYEKAWTAQSQQADDALQSEEIPAAHRGTVRGYFDAISPEQIRSAPGATTTAPQSPAPSTQPRK